MLAATKGFTEIVALLVEEGADVNQINAVSVLGLFVLCLCNLFLTLIYFNVFSLLPVFPADGWQHRAALCFLVRPVGNSQVPARTLSC